MKTTTRQIIKQEALPKIPAKSKTPAINDFLVLHEQINEKVPQCISLNCLHPIILISFHNILDLFFNES